MFGLRHSLGVWVRARLLKPAGFRVEGSGVPGQTFRA